MYRWYGSVSKGRMRSRQRQHVTKLLVGLHGDRCYYCQRTFEGTGRRCRTLDHLTPLSRGGTHDIANLTLSCQKCNGMKGDRTFWEYLQTPEYKVRRDRAQYARYHPPKIRPKIEILTTLEVATV